MEKIKIEIGQYRLIDKGSLKASFSLVIHPMGQKILQCKYFVQGDQRWFVFPQIEVKYEDGRKTEYIPYISYLNKEYLEQLKIAVVEALKEAKPQEKYGQAKGSSNQRKESSLPSHSSFDFSDTPF